MTLQEMITRANGASYFSRTTDEVLGAIDDAQFQLYTMAVRELRGALVKTDLTTITNAWKAGTDTYALPPDFGKMIQLAEREAPGNPWRPMTPMDLNNPAFVDDQFDYAGPEGFGEYSAFAYYGPYLADAGGWWVKVAPMPEDGAGVRTVQIIYQAAYAPLETATSALTLPQEATYAILQGAIARLLQLNSDQNAQTYQATAQDAETRFLSWLRGRQVQRAPVQRMYLEGD